MKTQRQFKDDLVVLRDEKYPGDIVPQKRNQLLRNIQLSGNVEVVGGIWCNELIIEAQQVFLHRSVFAEQQIVLNEAHHTGQVCFNGLVSSNEHVVMAPDQQHLFIVGGVSTGNLKLKNALIIGNINAEKVSLERCAVFGNVSAKQLIVKDSILASTAVNELTFQGNVGLLFPVLSAKKINTSEGARVLQLLDFALNSSDVCSLFEIDTEASIKRVTNENGQEFDVLSTLDRLFDLHVFKQQVEEKMERVIHAALSNLSPAQRLQECSGIYKDCFNLINSGFAIVSDLPLSKFYEMDENDEAMPSEELSSRAD